MAQHIARGVTNSRLTPYLSTWIATQGRLIEPALLTFEIYDVSTPELEDEPLLVVPTTPVDLTLDRVSFGRYAARWDVPSDEPLGRHHILWSAALTLDGPVITWGEKFDVIASTLSLPRGPLYALVSDVRDEKAAASMSNTRILEKIAAASKLLTMWTGRSFVPAYKNVSVDGRGLDRLYLDEPIIALESIQGQPVTDRTDLVIYNRHITQGLLAPDDRDCPMIDFRSDAVRWAGWSGSWDSGPQAIRLGGVWGYTDPDGSPTGETPSLVRQVITRMVLRELPYQNTSQAVDVRRAGDIRRMRTREQEIEYQSGGSAAAASRGGRGGGADGNTSYTGDPSIDSIIEQLCRPVVCALI